MEEYLEECKLMEKNDLIDEIIDGRGDHIGIDLITKEDLVKYCKDNNFKFLNSKYIENIVDDLVKQSDEKYEGSDAQAFDNHMNDLVNGDRDSRVSCARHTLEELYSCYSTIERLRNEIKTLKEGKE